MKELIHPPHPNSTDDRLDPPLGLLYVASLETGEVRINDLSGLRDIEAMKSAIGYADEYGITVYIATIGIVRELIATCFGVNPDCTVTIGGAYPTEMGGLHLENASHYHAGPAERSRQELAQPNPLPWHLVDVASYHRTIDGHKSLPLLTTRGCPYHCAFCGLAEMHKAIGGVVYIDMDCVAREIEAIAALGIRAVNVQDDIFTLRKDRLRKICAILKANGLVFRCMGRAGHDDPETYDILAEAGCRGVAWGIESGSQYMLDRMRKKVTVQQNHDVIQWCKERGMDSRAFFVMGFPGETRATMAETIDFIYKADPDQYFLSNFIPYPGTPVFQKPWEWGVTEMSYDFDQYYQVNAKGEGGACVSTVWMGKEEMQRTIHSVRESLARFKPLRGRNLQQYEVKHGPKG